MTNQDLSIYRGKRALLLLRVSTLEQEKGFGWPSQEREIRKKIVEPLNLKLDEQRHIIRDSYTGLDFRERPALDLILEMARNQEFDLLVIDVLDRLGRKGIARELYRMQLKELGVRILTTDPNDHSDDDSLIGEMVRLIKGYQSEEELNNIRRRTVNGKHAKAEGRNQDGTFGPKRVVGVGSRLYGYRYLLDGNGKRVNFVLNEDIILVDEEGTEWTEVKVVVFIFESIAKGTAIRSVCHFLNDKGIPSPNVAKGIKMKVRDSKEKNPPIWQPTVIRNKILESGYWGEKREFKSKNMKMPGKKYPVRRATEEEEQVIVAIPAIVTKELAEAARERLEQNKQNSSRNNKHPEESLLRSGSIRCGYCGGAMIVNRDRRPKYSKNIMEGIGYLVQYYCSKHHGALGKCIGCSIGASHVDNAAWEKAVSIIKDTTEIDKIIDKYRTEDPTTANRKHINEKLSEIKRSQANFRKNLVLLMIQEEPDQETIAYLNSQLKHLEEQEKGWVHELAKEEGQQEKWKKVDEKLNELHQKYLEMKERMNDLSYDPLFNDKRDMIEFLGITVKVWRKDHRPHFKVECTYPNIVLRIS